MITIKIIPTTTTITTSTITLLSRIIKIYCTQKTKILNYLHSPPKVKRHSSIFLSFVTLFLIFKKSYKPAFFYYFKRISRLMKYVVRH